MIGQNAFLCHPSTSCLVVVELASVLGEGAIVCELGPVDGGRERTGAAVSSVPSNMRNNF